MKLKQLHQTSAIFDMDGTLIDSMTMWANIGTGYVRSLGYELPQDVEDKMRVMSLLPACTLCAKELNMTQTPEELVTGMWNAVGNFYEHEVELKAGVLAYLDKLQAAGVDLYIATATDRPLVEKAVARTGIGAYFKGIITCAEAGKGKSDSKIFLDALEQVDGDLSSTVVYEDSLVAIETAKAAGFQVVGIYDVIAAMHQTQIQDLVDVYIQDFTELL
ncbi:HAD family hydrolase [Bengtsoniella intestinalis]|uniref:HAD family hydrolase n=1 Tax=Bengtsoniella intestinalis TaxID=3073143 RepID=UPI00391EE73A